MVVDQLRTQFSDEEMDRLFQAFADATRRDIVRRVTVAEYSVSGLAALYTMSFAAVQKHVAVLERASLVAKEKRGREQIVRANHEGLQKARRLLDEYEVIWRQRADRIADLLAETAGAEPGPTQAGSTKTSKTETGKSQDRKGLS
jgi:DNA-binding transcriptional ArsR family regulator